MKQTFFNPFMIVMLIIWCFSDGACSFINKEKLKSHETKNIFQIIHKSKSSDEASSESSSMYDDRSIGGESASPTRTHSIFPLPFTEYREESGGTVKEKPLKSLEHDDVDSDLENVSDYEDNVYGKKTYNILHDTTYSIPSLSSSSERGGGGGASSSSVEEEAQSGESGRKSEGGGGSESEIFNPSSLRRSLDMSADGHNQKLLESTRNSSDGVGHADGGSQVDNNITNLLPILLELESTVEEKEEIEIGEQQEKLLLQKLMRGYEKDVRPVRNASQPVLVRVGITLTQIFDMDEKQQVLTTNVWLDQEWNDEMLRWDPKLFGGLEMIRLPCDRIWKPDIVLYNSADDYTRGYMPSRAMVSSDGNVFWPPPTKFRSTCSVDVTYFPFDDQVCSLKLGSWTYNGFQVDVTNRTSAVDLSNYITNGEWELVKAVQQRNVVYYSCCIEPFPDVTITLVIRRKTLYYIYNIVLPCIMLSSLTLLVFCLPSDSGEKIALGITVLLAFSVFMLAINESLPETSESIPLIGVYLTIVMAITSISVIMTVVVLNLHYLGPQVRPVPGWLMCLLPKGDGKSRIRQKSLLIPVTHKEPKSGSLKRGHIFITQLRRGASGEGYAIEVPHDEKSTDLAKTTSNISLESITNETTGNSLNARRRFAPQQSSSEIGSTFPGGRQQQRHSTLRSQGTGGIVSGNREQSDDDGGGGGAGDVFEELLTSIRHLIRKQEDVEAQNNLVAEWRLVAQVVDRILFWLFFIFTFTSSAMILLVLPIYKRSWYGSPLIVINDTDVFET